MSLDDVSNGSNYDPIVKYNARDGVWTFRRSKDDEVSIDNPTFVADYDNVLKGCIKYIEGKPPAEILVKASEAMPSKPDESYKETIVLRVYSDSFFGGVAKFGPTSMHAMNALKDLYNEYITEKQDGKLPVVQCTGFTEMKDKLGTNRKPNFKIVKWVDRPAAFDANDNAPIQGSTAAQDAQPAQASAVSEF